MLSVPGLSFGVLIALRSCPQAHALKRPGHMLAAAVDPNSLPEPPAY